jgi:hypothetical protein
MRARNTAVKSMTPEMYCGVVISVVQQRKVLYRQRPMRNRPTLAVFSCLNGNLKAPVEIGSFLARRPKTDFLVSVASQVRTTES